MFVFAMTDPFAFKYDKYSLSQKEKLAKLCLKYKLEADSSKEKHWDLKERNLWQTNNLSSQEPYGDFFPL